MGKVGQMIEPVLIALSRAIAGWFPQLDGRAFAVSEVDPFDGQTNVPTLPVAVLALLTEQANQSTNGGRRISLSSQVMLQFIFEPVKYKRQNGSDTPFYAYYDYEAVRDRLLRFLTKWRTPRNGAVSYQTMDVESDEFAVYIAFKLLVTEEWCDPNLPLDCEEEEPFKVRIVSKVLQPSSSRDCCNDCPEPEDPCDFARERNPYG